MDGGVFRVPVHLFALANEFFHLLSEFSDIFRCFELFSEFNAGIAKGAVRTLLRVGFQNWQAVPLFTPFAQDIGVNEGKIKTILR